MKNLAKLRKAAGMTQAELAGKMGVNQATVAMWENETIWPSADKLPALARLLGCSIDALYADQSA